MATQERDSHGRFIKKTSREQAEAIAQLQAEAVKATAMKPEQQEQSSNEPRLATLLHARDFYTKELTVLKICIAVTDIGIVMAVFALLISLGFLPLSFTPLAMAWSLLMGGGVFYLTMKPKKPAEVIQMEKELDLM